VPQVLHSPEQRSTPSFASPPAEAPSQPVRAMMLDHGQAFVRAVTAAKVGKADAVVVSSLPVNQAFLKRVAADLGEIAIYSLAGSAPGVTVTEGDSSHQVSINEKEISAPLVRGGKLPAPSGRWDIELGFGSFLRTIDWSTGKQLARRAAPVIQINTRPSILYSRLNAGQGEYSNIVVTVLVAIAITFGLIELFALIIGLGLTRTITRSVAALYRGTQHINRGDFRHRITVKARDQLAALETSFNSMTESLEKLIAEQKEKQRLESELAIAQEVQAQLFPR